MRISRDPKRLPLSSGSAVTIGNFDGVHRGHRALVERCRERAGRTADVAVVTFEPLPRYWLDPDTAPPRLTGPGHKLGLLHDAGVDLVWMMRFNARLASMSAEDFARRVLRDGLRARHVVIGADFRFGRRREGDVAQLERFGRDFGFGTEVLPTVERSGLRVSSTAVREALATDRLELAGELLGRPYTHCGRVVRGRQLGRRLGYPTANLRLPPGGSPLGGIYAVRARVAGGPWRDGIANLGVRPAVGGGEPLLEVHLFDFHARRRDE
ncbi:MAG: bifunctional riboflavin kinase/FAD synthetase [Gammaproteobacteria bacterium]